MTKIEFADDMIQIDAQVLAKAFRIGTDDLKQGMRDGTITSRFERGEDDDAGRFRLTFFSADRRVRITADETGHVLTCSAVDYQRPRMRVSRPDGGENQADAARRARLDRVLDAALQDTFPASDPIAICFDSPHPAPLLPKESDEEQLS